MTDDIRMQLQQEVEQRRQQDAEVMATASRKILLLEHDLAKFGVKHSENYQIVALVNEQGGFLEQLSTISHILSPLGAKDSKFAGPNAYSYRLIAAAAQLDNVRELMLRCTQKLKSHGMENTVMNFANSVGGISDVIHNYLSVNSPMPSRPADNSDGPSSRGIARLTHNQLKRWREQAAAQPKPLG